MPSNSASVLGDKDGTNLDTAGAPVSPWSVDQIRQALRRRSIVLVPAVVFVGIVATFGTGLFRDPRLIPSALLGRSAPAFNLPPVEGRTLGLSRDDLGNEISLVNVFASWCVSCREEHPIFMYLKEEGTVVIHGLNYKDRPNDAGSWLDLLGDPYARTGADIDGRVAIDLGVYGVPETFVIGRDGRIVYKHVGPVTSEVLNRTILPLVAELRR